MGDLGMVGALALKKAPPSMNREPTSSPDAAPPAYTRCYCEENVYKLLEARAGAAGRRLAVFVSNAHKKVVFFGHGERPGGFVVWDYHVVALEQQEGAGWCVYDHDFVDGRLPGGALRAVPVSEYVERCLLAHPVRPEFAHWFRVIDADLFLRSFHSDRSHMIGADGAYQSPPPAWPPICAGDATLPSLWAMERGAGIGEVLGTDEFQDRFSDNRIV